MGSKKPNDTTNGVFTTGTSISDSGSWFASLIHQLKELQDERKHPPTPVVITAKSDYSALDNLIDSPSAKTSLFSSVREFFNDRLHPRHIETTATPVEVEEIWSKPKTGVPRLLSVMVHLGIVALILIPWATAPNAPILNATSVVLLSPPDRLTMPQMDVKSGGGGGGGNHSLTPPSLGKLPRGADKQLVPPTPIVKNLSPELIAEPTIVAPQLSNLPQVSVLQLGDPDGVPGPPSAGPGSGGGIGTGNGRGVGSGSGPGAGPGEGGGTGGGVFRVGGGVSEPSIIRRIEPQYSEEARKARFQGTVVLHAIVRRDGTVDILQVVRSLGYGLDENAIAALKQWKFRPGMRGGQPVDVDLNIEVNFNLR